MDFTPVISSVAHMQAWNASGNDFSFVISHGSENGPGFRGQIGFTASWRPSQQDGSATEVGGSPFRTFAEAVSACRSMASLLTKPGKSRGRQPYVDFDTPAVLSKWVSLNNERRTESHPYLLVDGTLHECLRHFMAKPASTRHLYDIRVSAHAPLRSSVLPKGLVTELAGLQNL